MLTDVDAAEYLLKMSHREAGVSLKEMREIVENVPDFFKCATRITH